jgi:uncharacterized phage infection (PIP) family protein YhgE
MAGEQIQKLAERIALLLQDNEKGNEEFSSLHSVIEKINERLAKIEAKLETQNSDGFIHSSNFPVYSSRIHPSREKFSLAESVAPEIIGHSDIEKACPYEPNGKPCDYCAMCSSRGF